MICAEKEPEVDMLNTSAPYAEILGLESFLETGTLPSACLVRGKTQTTTRTLVIRLGAYGDCIITTPLLRHLKSNGNEVYMITSAQGMEILKGNPNIDKFIYYPKDSIPNNKLGDFFEAVRKAYECDEAIDLCESLEWALALHPKDPVYNYPRLDREKRCNKNYYEHTFDFAKRNRNGVDMGGELFFTEEEEKKVKGILAPYKDKFVVLWGLSGSGRNKTYPFAPYVMADLIKRYPRMVIITVGDLGCEILEVGMNNKNVIGMSGKTSFRESALMTKYVDLLVSPDTGLLHASGCYETPKIGLFGHSTIENISKHFKNDHSIEAKCSCAPCFRLIYHAPVQCPIDPISSGCWCMTEGLPPKRVYDHIRGVMDKIYYGSK